MHREPEWMESHRIKTHSSELCSKEEHNWVAQFVQSGALAAWECNCCKIRKIVKENLQEALEAFSCWVESPMILVYTGKKPPISGSCWKTPDNTILFEGSPTSISYLGQRIPSLEKAHAYTLKDGTGRLLESYQPERKRLGIHGDHYILIRYQIVGSDLIRYESHCFEDSTYEIPNTKEPEKRVILSDLEPIRG